MKENKREELEAKVKAIFPEDVEGMYISKNDYDRLYGDMTLENIELKEEIERLNNIINELEKWLLEKSNTETESEKEGYFNPSILRERATLRLVYDYLQNLKDSDKE